MQIIDELDAAMRKQFAEQPFKNKRRVQHSVPDSCLEAERNIGVDGR